MDALGVRKVYVLDDQDPFEIPLAELVAGDAERAGIVVAAHDSLDTTPGSAFGGEVAKIVKSRAEAVFFAGGTGAGTVALWRQLHNADPGLLLLGSNALVSESFTSEIGAAGASTYMTTPVLPVADYPPSAARVLADYRRRFGGEPEAYALYGYEAMSVVLGSISEAGLHGNDRRTVIDRFFATRNRNSVIGRYSIEPDGETTLSSYGSDRVVEGRPVFYRVFDVG